MFNKLFLNTILIGTALCACTVKEDRMECPAYVTVQADTAVDCLISFYTHDGTIVRRDLVKAADITSGNNATPVPRGEMYVSVVQSFPSMTADCGRTVECLPDSAVAELHAISRELIITSDDYLFTARLAKQYAHVYLSFVDIDSSLGYAYDVRVVSHCNGLDLITLQANDGTFRHSLDLKGTLSTEFNLLRQRDGDVISIEFLDRETSEVLNEVLLSDFIARSGYSWSAADLPDIHILIDYVRAGVTVSVSGWEKPQTFSFVI